MDIKFLIFYILNLYQKMWQNIFRITTKLKFFVYIVSSLFSTSFFLLSPIPSRSSSFILGSTLSCSSFFSFSFSSGITLAKKARVVPTKLKCTQQAWLTHGRQSAASLDRRTFAWLVRKYQTMALMVAHGFFLHSFFFSFHFSVPFSNLICLYQLYHFVN